jgi:hypothetical protein
MQSDFPHGPRRHEETAKRPATKPRFYLRIFEGFIANSSQGFDNPGIGVRPKCQFLATEVSRDFIPPCPVRISPAQAAALGPAIAMRAMRNPSHQLNTKEKANHVPVENAYIKELEF